MLSAIKDCANCEEDSLCEEKDLKRANVNKEILKFFGYIN